MIRITIIGETSGTRTGAVAVAPLAVALTAVSPLDWPFTLDWAWPFASVTAVAGAMLAIFELALLKVTDLPATGAPLCVTVALAVVDSPF